MPWTVKEQDLQQDTAKALESKVMKLSLGHAIPSWARHGQSQGRKAASISSRLKVNLYCGAVGDGGELDIQQ
eukprot:s1080_g32.t1